MNLNDPFNRLSKQQHNEYLTFKETLKNSQVDSLSSAEALIADMKKRAWTLTLIISIVVLVIAALFQEIAVIAIVFGIVIALWLLTNSYKGQRYVKRYIQQEFSNEV